MQIHKVNSDESFRVLKSLFYRYFNCIITYNTLYQSANDQKFLYKEGKLQHTISAVKKLRKLLTYMRGGVKVFTGEHIMIKRFKVSNFKGFTETIDFKLYQTHDYSFNKHLIKDKIVNKAIIYGKNGSGKSNLGYALYDITLHLTDKQKSADIYQYNYINLDNDAWYAEFEFEFEFDGQSIIYSYGKTKGNELVFEKIVIEGSMVLNYDIRENRKNIVLSISGYETLNLDLFDGSLSFLKYIYKNSPSYAKSPVTKIVEFAEHMLWFRCLSDGNLYIGYKDGSERMDEIIINSNKIKEFESFLNKQGLNYKLVSREINNTKVLYAVFKKGEALFSSIISSGTRALWLYYCWSISFENVSFLFLDEFDAYYHFETAELILKAINDNPNMQAVVTSHNTYLMRNSITRPDCCFILTNNKITSISECTDKEIREAHNLEKMYRNGAFTE